MYEFSIEDGVGRPLAFFPDLYIHRAREGESEIFSLDSAYLALATFGGELQVFETTTWTSRQRVPFRQDKDEYIDLTFAFGHRSKWLAASNLTDETLSILNFETNKTVFQTKTRVADPGLLLMTST